MKKLFLLLAVISATFLSSCEGEQGVPGQDGYSAESAVYEITNVDFLPNSYAILYSFPNAILSSDHILVYRLSGSFQGEDVWQSIPQTIYFNDGSEFDYNFDFTKFDVNIYLDGNVTNLSSEWTQNQIFRIVVVPGQFANRIANMDISNYSEVVKSLKIEDKQVKSLLKK